MPTFSLTRSTYVDADPGRVHDLVDDFRKWQQWSPWEGVDPELSRTYSGPERGVGSRYEWTGNSKAGTGTMEIVESDPGHVVVDLRFLKPFEAVNVTRFGFEPTNGGTDVTWSMTGERGVLMGLMGRLFFDRVLGKDFDRGLAQLKTAAES